jgi:predicted flap endonuclease-1-like 5' DNA nuclease
MAKKPAAKDLDAELAALEAELAALEAKKKAPAKGPDSAKAASSAAPAPAPQTSSPQPKPQPLLWRRDGDAWVRTVPGDGPVVRRVLDEQGNVVREEPATRRDLDENDDVKAERGVGKLLGRFRK